MADPTTTQALDSSRNRVSPKGPPMETPQVTDRGVQLARTYDGDGKAINHKIDVIVAPGTHTLDNPVLASSETSALLSILNADDTKASGALTEAAKRACAAHPEIDGVKTMIAMTVNDHHLFGGTTQFVVGAQAQDFTCNNGLATPMHQPVFYQNVLEGKNNGVKR